MLIGLVRKYLNRQDVLLYLLFFITSLGRFEELFAVLIWVVIYQEVGNSLKAMLTLLPVFIYLIVSSIFGFAITGFPTDHFLEQMAQLMVYMGIYYAFMMHYRGNLYHVFSVFVNFAFMLAVAGILQYFFGRFAGVKIFFFDNTATASVYAEMRAQAWVDEAGYFAMYMVPALVYTMFSKGLEHWKTLTFIVAGLLSFSPVFKLVLILSILYYFTSGRLKFSRLLLYSIVLLAFNYVYTNYKFSDYEAGDTKSSETIEYLTASLSELENANVSTYSLLKNFRIACMADNRITGTGIGTHGYSHDKYYHSTFYFADINKWDAYSLFTRLFSELGIVGICLFFYFLVKCHNRQSLVNMSILFYFIYALLRGGHYTIFGLQFFIMLYYFTSRYKNYAEDMSQID